MSDLSKICEQVSDFLNCPSDWHIAYINGVLVFVSCVFGWLFGIASSALVVNLTRNGLTTIKTFLMSVLQWDPRFATLFLFFFMFKLFHKKRLLADFHAIKVTDCLVLADF